MYGCIGDSLLDREGARSSGSALVQKPSSPKALEFFLRNHSPSSGPG